MPQTEGTLTVGPDEPLPPTKATLLGLQHVSSMDVYVVPLIIASVLTFAVPDATGLTGLSAVAAIILNPAPLDEPDWTVLSMINANR